MSDVFISYSRLDQEFVGRLRDALISQTQDVWIDWESIPPSRTWWNEIQKGIARANNFVVVLSPNSMASPICQMEIEYARQLGKRIIPVLHMEFNREETIRAIATRLASSDQDAVRQLWGDRQPHAIYDDNDHTLKHINYFFFRSEDEFEVRFAALMEVIRTDYDYKEQHTTLQLRALEWDRRSRNPSFLLLDDELNAAQAWFESSVGKAPPPTDLHRNYITASQKRTRDLRRIRRASVLGSALAVVSILVALVAALIGVQASGSASAAVTREAAANAQSTRAIADANTALTREADANQQRATATRQLFEAQSTATQIPPTLTQAAHLMQMSSEISAILSDRYFSSSERAALLDSVVERYPEQAEVYVLRGQVFAQAGDVEAAIADFNEAIRLDPTNATTYDRRGTVYLDSGNFEAAIADFSESIRLNPAEMSAYYNRGIAYQDQGDWEAALADYTEAIRFNPTFASFYHNRGTVYLEKGNWQAAVADFSQVIRLDPTSSEAYNGRGLAYYNQRNLEAAVADYNEAIRLDPTYDQVYWGRANAYHDLGRYPESIADYRQYEALHGELEPYMVGLIAEMEAALTATPAGN